MGILFRYKYHLLAILLLLGALFAGVKTKVTQVTKEAKDLPPIETQGQISHALELKIFATNSNIDLRPFILAKVKSSLPKAYRHRAFEIAHSVIAEANHHGLDPFFLLAVITTESSFNVKARGRHGEIGLMQILPVTAKWLAPHAGVASNRINLEDPATNIRIGATYFARLRKRFNNHGTRYVSAYNMGVTNVFRLVKKQVEPMKYSSKVLGNYRQFYASLEKTISTPASRRIASTK